jgi:hypothetical protein
MHMAMTFNVMLAALPTLRLAEEPAEPRAEAAGTPDLLGDGLADILMTW